MATANTTVPQSHTSHAHLDCFTGYWRLVKVEDFEEFLIRLGVPWVVRKAAIRFGGGKGSSVELISNEGAALTVTTLNVKGSWTRTYDTSSRVQQESIDGSSCSTTSWTEGRVLESLTEGSPFGSIDSSRLIRGNTMVVRTTVMRKSNAEQDATMYWYFERMTRLELHLSARGGSLHRQIALDRSRVERASKRNAFIRHILMDFNRWETPADQFIALPVSCAMSAHKGGTAVGTASPPPWWSGTPKKSASVSSLSRSTGKQRSTQKNVKKSTASNQQSAAHSRVISADMSPQWSVRSPSSDSLSPSGRSPSPPPTGTEALMAYKIREFLDARAITSVVPVLHPHDTNEPELLEMSPEQAEETAAKLRELEHELMLGRQESARGCSCWGLALSRQSQTLPEHLRVWEMTL